MRSDSVVAWAVSSRVFVRDCVPVPYFLTHECSDAWLMPSSADADFSEGSSLFSYRATVLRLNSSEYLDVVVGYQSFQPDWAGDQASTKQGSGPNLVIAVAHKIAHQTRAIRR